MDAGTYAVVMGDLVASEAASSRRALHRTFNAAIDTANAAFAAALASPLTITLGDEFQGLAGDLPTAMRIAWCCATRPQTRSTAIRSWR